MSAIRWNLQIRSDHAQDVITRAGANAKLKAYSGTPPAGTGAPVAGTNTQLALATFGPTIGTMVNGTIDWDEAGAVQVPAGFVNGTPTFFDLTTSADALVGRFEVNTTDAWTWSGTVATGQPFSLTGLVTTMPGAI